MHRIVEHNNVSSTQDDRHLHFVQRHNVLAHVSACETHSDPKSSVYNVWLCE